MSREKTGRITYEVLPHSTGGFYPKTKVSVKATTDDLCDALAKKTSIHVIDVKSVLMALFDKIAEKCKQGYKVDLDGFCYFAPALKCEPGISDIARSNKPCLANRSMVRNIRVKATINRKWRRIPKDNIRISREVHRKVYDVMRRSLLQQLFAEKPPGSTLTSWQEISPDLDLNGTDVGCDLTDYPTREDLYSKVGVWFPDDSTLQTVGDAIDYLEKHV
jgi:hypothetical protein